MALTKPSSVTFIYSCWWLIVTLFTLTSSFPNNFICFSHTVALFLQFCPFNIVSCLPLTLPTREAYNNLLDSSSLVSSIVFLRAVHVSIRVAIHSLYSRRSGCLTCCCPCVTFGRIKARESGEKDPSGINGMVRSVRCKISYD